MGILHIWVRSDAGVVRGGAEVLIVALKERL
jgi:hypothetical protein